MENETKPGIRTTEFWMTLIAIVVGAALQMELVAEGTPAFQALVFIGQVFAAMGYVYSRSMVKSAK